MIRAFFLWSVVLVLSGFLPVAAAEIEIVKLDFDQVEQPGGRDPWYQISVTFNVERGDREPHSNPRFADEVSVELAFATESDRGGGTHYAFYSATAEFPTLEVGRHVTRFYLPPELVKRDRVRGEPHAYLVEIASGAETAASILSANLRGEGRLTSFMDRAANEGSDVLRLQEESPFAWINPRGTPVAKKRSE